MQKRTSKNNLTIGLVLDDGLDRLDGVQAFIVTIGEYFKSKGHKVHYLVGQTSKKEFSNVHSLSKNISVVSNGGNQLTIPLPANRSKLKKILSSYKFDVLHVQTPYSPMLAGGIVKLADQLGIPLVGTFHILPYSKSIIVGAKLMGFLQKKSIKRFDKFFSVSSPAKIFAKDAYHIDSETMLIPVDINKFKPKSTVKKNKKDLKIVYLNRLVKRKGCLQLLKSIKYIEDHKLTSKKYTLEIVSDGAMRSKLEKFVDENGLRKKVFFHGYVDEATKARLLQKADIAVFPSISGESFGIVLIEAMASGAGVVLAGNNPGYSSVLGGTNVSFDPYNTKNLAILLARYLNDENYRDKVHKEQQQDIKKYDIQIIGDELLKTYKRLQK